MKPSATFPSIIALTGFLLIPIALGQAPAPNDSGSVRVNVTVNPDGSRTSYQFDNANHKATAVTTDSQGKVQGKTVYRLDQQDRFGTSVSFSANGKLHHKSIYKYDANGRMEEETQLGKDDAVQAKIVYAYDSAGKQTGYSIFDAAGKLLGKTSAAPPASPTAPPKATPKRKK